MGETKIILVDMDGVVCDFDKRANELYQTLYPHEKVLSESRSCFYLAEAYLNEFGAEANERIQQIITSEGFFSSLPPIPGAVEAIKRIDQLPGVHVFFCTSPLSSYQHCTREKYEWIDNNFGFDWTKRVIMTKDKTTIKGTILIDDKPIITGRISQPDWVHVVFDQSYNRELMSHHRLRGWTDWQHVQNVLVDILNIDFGAREKL